MMKKLVRWIYRKRYGVRGDLKPPLGWWRAGPCPSLWRRASYQVRWWLWWVNSRVYNWTGLPQEWEKKMEFYRRWTPLP